MDVSRILAELKAERAQIEEAIQSLERLAMGRKRGPGRPRTSINLSGSAMPSGDASVADGFVVKRRGRPPGSKNKPRPTAPITASAGTTQ
jgi:hypothetical protein